MALGSGMAERGMEWVLNAQQLQREDGHIRSPARFQWQHGVVPMIYWEGKTWDSTTVITAGAGDTRGQDNVRITLLRTWMIKLIAIINNNNIVCQILLKILRIYNNILLR